MSIMLVKYLVSFIISVSYKSDVAREYFKSLIGMEIRII